MRERSTHQQTLAFRRGAAALAAIVLLANLASWYHEAFVTHATCPEHGELVDVARAPTGSHLVRLEELDGHAHLRPSPDAGRRHNHDHCAFGLFSRQRQATTRAVPLSTPHGISSEPAPAPLAVPRLAGIPVYLVAPKTSPPAVLARQSLVGLQRPSDVGGRVAPRA